MTTNTPLPKRYGAKLPASIDAGSFVSVTLCFYDILEYRAAFNGSINMLGKWFSWDHTQADYSDIPQKNIDVAQIWSEVLASADWNEGCMAFCERMIECLTTDSDVQQTLADLIASNPLIRQSLQTLIDSGSVVPNPTSPIVASEDLDALFGAVTFLVDTMNGANVNLYAALEASTNNRESGQIMFAAVPVLETLPLDEASEYIDFLAASVAENYNAQYTTTPITGMRDRLRCGLFCLARDNGNALTWDLIANYFWQQVSFTTSTLVTAFIEFVDFVITGSWSGDEIVYISFGNIAAALSQTQKFSGMTFPSLSAIMALGLNDPDPDWETLCLDCPPDPVGGLNIVAYEAWLPYVTWEFIGMSGSDEIWQVTLIAGSPSGSFTGLSDAGIDFYIMNEEIIYGSFTNVREYNSAATQTTAPFHDDILITVYFAAFGDGFPARMRVTLRPVP